jgi:hypothetical protein
MVGLSDSDYLIIHDPWLVDMVALVMIFNMIVLLVFAGGDSDD